MKGPLQVKIMVATSVLTSKITVAIYSSRLRLPCVGLSVLCTGDLCAQVHHDTGYSYTGLMDL